MVEAHSTKRWEDRAERAFASMANALPFIRERFTTHKAYGERVSPKFWVTA